MSGVQRPAAAYLLPRRFHYPQDDEDIEMGMIRPAGDENEDPPTSDGIPTELCRLQAIPLELRLKIYALVLVSSNQIVWQGRYKTAKRRTSGRATRYTCNKIHGTDNFGDESLDDNIFSLLLTCKAIYSEAAATFYRHNDFVFKCRTASNHLSAASFATSPSHKLSCGLPYAFENEVFRANVHYLVFACINSKKRGRYHNCGLEKAGDNIIEVAGRCAVLEELSTQQSERSHVMRRWLAEADILCVVSSVVICAVCVLLFVIIVIFIVTHSRST